MVPLKYYKCIHDTLLNEGNQWVIGLYMNVLWPIPWRSNHEKKAQQIPLLFDALREKYPFLPDVYNMVGHSVGGKISLMVAIVYDPTRVGTVIALDPVDQNPHVFTAKDGNCDKIKAGRSSLGGKKIVLTLTDGGSGISKDHNAEAIRERFPDGVELIRHKDSGHMAYADEGGGVLGRLIPGGTDEGNKAAKEDALRLIRAIFIQS